MRIAVLCLPGIGDSLMATPMVHTLRQNFPKATIDIICMFDGVAYCYKNNKDVNHVYRLSLYNVPLIKGIWEILMLRRKNHYDISLLAFPAYRREYHVVQFLLGAKRRIAHVFSKGFWKECNFLDTNRIEVDESVHNVINNLNLLNALGITWEHKKTLRYFLTLQKKDSIFGKEYIQHLGWSKAKIVGIHPGSMDSEAGVKKRWDFENYVKVVKHVIKNGWRAVIFMGPAESDAFFEKALSSLKNERNCNIVKNTSFGESLGILNQVDLLISNDNGFAHIANALGKKEIVLFGPTNPLWCIPIDMKLVHPIRKATFTPWFRNDMKVTNPPKRIKSGMEKIVVDDVLKAIRRIGND